MGEIKLDDICEAIVDCEHKTAPLTAFGYPSVRTTNIKNGRIDWDNCNRVDEATYEAWTRRREPKPGDLILAREAPVGEVGLIPEEHKAVLGQRTVLICPDRSKVDPRYLHFLLISPDVQADMLGKATGSTVEHLNMSDIRALPLPELPPLPEQRSIARVLGGLDDKIELNRRMNRTLEDLARGLFRSWFVDFDPVLRRAGAAGPRPGSTPHTPPHAPWPARLVDSPLGPVPEGWRVGTVYEHADVIYGAPFASSKFNTDGRGLPLIRIRDLSDHNPEVFTDEDHPKGTRIHAGDIVVGMDGEFRAHVWRGPECWLNQRMCQFKPKRAEDAAFVLYAIEPLLAEVERSEVGTTVIHLGKADMDKFKVVCPPRAVMDAFAKIARPMLDQMVANGIESRRLAATRDALLPVLLSGEVRLRSSRQEDRAVRDAERAVGDSLQPAGTPRRGDGITHPRTGKAACSTKGRA